MILRPAIAALMTVLFCGCATVEYVPAADPPVSADGMLETGTVVIDNTTWRLFMLPIASGNPEKPNCCSCRWFRNTGTLENQMKMLEGEAKKHGAGRVVNVSTLTTDEDFMLLILLREKIHTSATLVK